MENYWLNKKDTYSLMQGDFEGNNLDIFYSSPFVENDVLEEYEIIPADHVSPDKIQYGPTLHTPVLEKTMNGTLYIGDKLIQKFYPIEECTDFIKKFNTIADSTCETTVTKFYLNCCTGIVTTFWTKLPKEKTKLIVNYKFDMCEP